MTDANSRLQELGPRGWTLLAAEAFGVGAVLIALFVSLLSLGGFSLIGGLVFGLLFAPGAVVGGFAVGGILWGVLVEFRRTFSYVTGTLVGAMTALLSHFVVPLFHVLGIYAPPLGIFSSNGGLINQVIDDGVFTLTIGGMVTIPVGAYIGWRLAVFRQPTIAGSDTTAVDDATTE